MKNYIQILLFAAAALTGACSNDEWDETRTHEEGVSTIQAVIADTAPQTRTTLSGTTLKWATGDVMGVACDQGVKRFVSLSAGATVTFTGPAITSPTMAYYPFSEVDGDGISGNTLTLTLPTEREFVLNATNSPMLATQYNEGFAFQHLCGLMSFRLNSITKNVKKVVLTSEDKNLAGTFSVDLSAGEPTIKADNATNGSQSVSFLIDQTTTGSKTFYFPLPVATYSKLTLSLRDADDQVLFEKSVKNKDITRGMLLNMNTLTTLTMKPSEVKATLEELLDESSSHDVTIQLSEVTDGDYQVEIPKAMGASAAVHLWLPKGNAHKLEVNEAQDTHGVNYLYQVDVCVPESDDEVSDIEGKWTETPEWAETADAPDVEMHLPNISYIYIKSNDITTHEARLGTLTVEPKTRTTILHANIRVNQVNVAKGGVYVNGIVGAIKKIDTGTSTHSVTLQSNGTKRDAYVYEYDREGITMTTYKWNSNICKPLKDAEGAYLIRTAPELAYFQRNYNNISAFDVYKLMANIDLYSKPWKGIILGDGATFDGNGFKVSYITITEYPDQYSSLDGVGFFSYTNSETTIKNLTLSTVKIGTSSNPIEYINVGGLVGYSACKEISNCTVQYLSIYTKSSAGSYQANGTFVGGLVGYGRGNISDCLVTFPSKYYGMTGTAVMGGLVGSSSGDVEITNSKLYVNSASPFITVNSEASTALGENYNGYAGCIGYFVGMASNISFKNCQFSTDNKTWGDPVDFSDTQWSAFGYASTRTPKGTAYIGNVGTGDSVTVNGTQWTSGVDYNVAASTGSGE